MPQNIYTLITSQFGISDNYATQAKKLNKNKLFFKNL